MLIAFEMVLSRARLKGVIVSHGMKHRVLLSNMLLVTSIFGNEDKTQSVGLLKMIPLKDVISAKRCE